MDQFGSMPFFLNPRPTDSGFTLLELAVVFSLMAVGIAVLLPTARRQQDRLAVSGAAEEVVGLLHRTRAEAVARGGAVLSLVSASASIAIVCNEDTLTRTELMERYGVDMDLSRDRGEAALAFGPLGLGQVANQTIRLRRGEAETRLIVSSLGRVVRK